MIIALIAPLTNTSKTGTLIGVGIAVIVVIAALLLLPNAFKSAREKKRVNELNSSYELYTVADGDTLWSIAEKFFGDGTKLSQIKSLNNMKLDGVVPGQILKIRELNASK